MEQRILLVTWVDDGAIGNLASNVVSCNSRPLFQSRGVDDGIAHKGNDQIDTENSGFSILGGVCDESE